MADTSGTKNTNIAVDLPPEPPRGTDRGAKPPSPQNHIKAETTTSLRLETSKTETALCLRVCFKTNESKQTLFYFFSPKSSGIFRHSQRVPVLQPASLTNL